jgi:hypothetical protein
MGSRRAWRREILAGMATVLGFSIVAFLVRLPIDAALIQGAVVVGTVPLGLYLLRDATPQSLEERVWMALAVLTTASAAALAVERVRDTTFDEATIALRGGGASVSGAYVTSTDYAVVLAVKAGSCAVIQAVPRDRIERITVGPKLVDPPACAARNDPPRAF